MSSLFESYKALNEAELFDVQTGMTGNIPVHMHDFLLGYSESWDTSFAWTCFSRASVRFRNVALAIRSLCSRVEKAQPAQKADACLVLGHYLHFVARNDVEAAKAYADSALKYGQKSAALENGGYINELCAVIALHRIYRTDPKCHGVAGYIDTIKARFELKMDPRFKDLNAPDQIQDPTLKSHAFCKLALARIVEWGDVSAAFDFLIQAEKSDENNADIADIASAVMMAMPDNNAVARDVTQILARLQAFDAIERVMAVCENLPVETFVEWRMFLSEMFALKLGKVTRAASCLFLCAVQNPAFWAAAVLDRSWIARFAAENDEFRIALFEGLKFVNDENLCIQVLSYISRFASQFPVRFIASLKHVRAVASQKHDAQVIRLITGVVKNCQPDQYWVVYDALLDLIRTEGTDLSTAWNAQIFHIADTLPRIDQNEEQFHCFLEGFLDEIANMHDDSDASESLRKTIINRLEHQNLDDQADEIAPITPENTPILASCLKLIENDSPELAIRAFGDWIQTGSDTFTALTVFAKIDAVLFKVSAYSQDQVSKLIGGASKSSLSRLLALAVILWPEDENWIARMDDEPFDGIMIAGTILQYMPYMHSGSALCDILIQRCFKRLNHNDVVSLMHEQMASCMLYDALFDQVKLMAENGEHSAELLSEIDEAIERFSGDVAQKVKLYARKYRFAQQSGDERVMLNSLRDILELSPNDAFAVAELKKLNPDDFRPHTQILYYQLRIFIETEHENRLANQTALALLYTKTSQLNNAITLYHTIIDEHPEFLEARYRLLDLLLSLENWKSAENVLLALVNAETTSANKYQALVRLAILQNEHMMMPSRALLTFFAALDTDPQKLNALHTKLCDISERLHSFSALLDKYEDFALHSDSYEIRKTATLLLAKVYSEQIHNSSLACNILDEFYSRGGNEDQDFLRFASDVYSANGKWASYVQVMAALLEMQLDPGAKFSINLNLAHVYVTRLNDFVHGAYYAEEASIFAPGKSEQWLDIADLFITCEKRDKAIEALHRAAETETDQRQKCLIMLENARLLAQLNRTVEAAECLHKAISYGPSIEQVTAIAEDLIAMSTVEQNKELFNSLCRDLIECSPECDRDQLILQQILTLSRVFGDVENARQLIEKYRNGFGELDLDKSLMLLQIYNSVENYEESVKLTEYIFVNFEPNREQQLVCWNCLLESAVDLEDVSLVQTSAEAILKLDPGAVSAEFRLIQLDYIAGRWDQAAERIPHILHADEQLKADDALLLHFYYGEILHAAEQDEEAFSELNQALSISHDFRPAVDLQLTIALSHQEWDVALPLFARLLELTDDTEVQGAIHKRIAELYHFYLNDLDQALLEYEQALTLGGDVEDVPIRLLHIYQQLEQWPKAAMTAQILAHAQVNSKDAKCDYLLVLAEILESHLNSVQEAINTYLEAFILDPYRSTCLRPLARLLVQGADWDNINGIYEHLCSLLGNPKAIDQLKCLAELTAAVPQCRNAVVEAEKQARRYVPDLELLPAMPPEAPRISESGETRRRVTTSPRGMLTVDSSLLRNPEIQPQGKDSQQSMMAVSKEIADPPSSVIELPDDALMPLDDDDFNLVEAATHVPPVHQTTNPFPPVSMRSSVQSNAINAVEKNTFTLEDIEALAKDAPFLTLHAVHDIFDIALVPHEHLDGMPAPALIPEIMIRNLTAPAGAVLNPAMIRLLSIFATSKYSPVTKSNELTGYNEVQNLPLTFLQSFNHLRNVMRRPTACIKVRPLESSSAFVGCSVPPVVFVDPASVSDMNQQQWTARMVFALVLLNPENLICASLSPVAVHKMLAEAADAMSSHSNLAQNLVADYKNMLDQAGFTASTMPVIRNDLLALIKTHTANVFKTAIHTAFILSQSLSECLNIVSELENIRTPSSLLTLKSAMKRSALMHDLVTFALSQDAQRLFDKIYHH